MTTIVRQYFVRAANARTITVFTTSTEGPETVTAILETAATRMEGATVVPADFVAHVTQLQAGSSYIFGTGGSLVFEREQDRNTLRNALEVVANVVAEMGFYLGQPTNIDPAVP